MDEYELIKESFIRTLKLIDYLDGQTEQLEKETKLLKEETDDKKLYEGFENALTEIRSKNKNLKQKLAQLAFKLSKDNETMMKILDDVYLKRNENENEK